MIDFDIAHPEIRMKVVGVGGGGGSVLWRLAEDHIPHVELIAVDTAERMWHNLLPEIGTTVNQYSRLVGLNKGRTAQTLVVRVWAYTGMALTADGWHTTRSSGSKKSQLHITLTSGWISIPKRSLTSVRMALQRSTIS